MSLETRKKYKPVSNIRSNIGESLKKLTGITCLLSPILCLIGYGIYKEAYDILKSSLLFVTASGILTIVIVTGLVLVGIVKTD